MKALAVRRSRPKLLSAGTNVNGRKVKNTPIKRLLTKMNDWPVPRLATRALNGWDCVVIDVAGTDQNAPLSS